MTNPIYSILGYKVRSIVRNLQSQTGAKVLTAGLGAFLLFFVGVVIYRVGVIGLEFVQGYVLYSQAFTLYIYELYVAILFYVVTFSATMLILFTLLRGEGDHWIAASPNYKIIPDLYFAKIVGSSLLSILMLAVPMVFAIHTVFDVGLYRGLLILFYITVIIIIAVLFSMTLVFGVSRLLLKIKLLSVTRVFLIAVSAIIVLLGFGWKQAVPSDFLEFWQIPITDVREFDVEVVSGRFTYFLTHPSAQLIFELNNGDDLEITTPVIQTILILVVLSILTWIATRNFLPIWQTIQEGNFEARTQKPTASGKAKVFPRVLHSPLGALLEKEFLLLRRDLKDFSWLLLIVSIWLMYTVLNVILKSGLERYDVQIDELPNAIYSFQIAIGIYFITAFVLRFVFPSFSTERKKAWILATAPIKLISIFFSKLVFFGMLFMFLGLIISIINFAIFNVSVSFIAVFSILFITAIGVITLFGLFLGIVFPNFETDNAEVLSTTMPGIIFTITSVLYGALGSYVLYLFVQNQAILPLILFEIFSVVIFAIMLRLSPLLLQGFEFSKRNLLA